MSQTHIEEPEAGWYVVRTRPKGEHIAAIHLQKYANLDEVFCPRIKFERSTKRGKVWFTEALFPGYIFARFVLYDKIRTVNATNAVSGVLRFDDRYPQIPDTYLKELREEFSDDEKELRIVKPELEEGDEVTMLTGPMAGIKTIVTHYIPGQERVRILLELLGEEREVEVNLDNISKPGNIRSQVNLG